MKNCIQILGKYSNSISKSFKIYLQQKKTISEDDKSKVRWEEKSVSISGEKKYTKINPHSQYLIYYIASHTYQSIKQSSFSETHQQMFFSHFISNWRRRAGESCPSLTWNESYVLWIILVLRLSSVLRTRPLLQHSNSEGLRQVVTSELERLERLLTVLVCEEKCPVDYLNSVRSSKVCQFLSVLALRLF